jgi:hypothetical protein
MSRPNACNCHGPPTVGPNARASIKPHPGHGCLPVFRMQDVWNGDPGAVGSRAFSQCSCSPLAVFSSPGRGKLSGHDEKGGQRRIVVLPIPCQEEFDGSRRLHPDRTKDDALEAQARGGFGDQGRAEPGPDQGKDRVDLAMCCT